MFQFSFYLVSTQNFPKKPEHFVPPDTLTYERVSEGRGVEVKNLNFSEDFGYGLNGWTLSGNQFNKTTVFYFMSIVFSISQYAINVQSKLSK